MPIYCYKHPNKQKFVEIIQSVKDKHEFVDKNGLKWERIYSAPNISIDTKINPFSERDFLEKTKNMKGNFGDLLDLSSEMSEKRSSKKDGIDPLKNKFLKEYSKKRKGKKHPKDKAFKKEIKKNGLTISI